MLSSLVYDSICETVMHTELLIINFLCLQWGGYGIGEGRPGGYGPYGIGGGRPGGYGIGGGRPGGYGIGGGRPGSYGVGGGRQDGYGIGGARPPRADARYRPY